jgi:ABC-type Co2+ transport system permease subunit
MPGKAAEVLRPASQETCPSENSLAALPEGQQGGCDDISRFIGAARRARSARFRLLISSRHIHGDPMHIEPGVLNASKVIYANVTAASALVAYLPPLLRKPHEIVKIALAAIFFSLFMEAFHMPAGPSELHFVGASAVYFVFGFLPALFGFAIGLLLQGLIFEPQDLVHLGVNSLSLMVPLIAVHALGGRRYFADDAFKPRLSWAEIVKFDAAYYAGVVGMVGFWLALGTEATPFASWALFAASYLPLVLCEPLFTFAVLKLLGKLDPANPIRMATAVDALAVA